MKKLRPCKNCESIRPWGMIFVDNEGKCVECGKMIAPRRKHKFALRNILATLTKLLKEMEGKNEQKM